MCVHWQILLPHLSLFVMFLPDIRLVLRGGGGGGGERASWGVVTVRLLSGDTSFPNPGGSGLPTRHTKGKQIEIHVTIELTNL